MGRTPPIRRRALPQAQPQVQGQVHERARGETEAPEKETFPRRHPRLGSQFQTKIAKLHHPSDRPKPEYLSKEYPHLTEEEAHGKAKGSNGMFCCSGFAVFSGRHAGSTETARPSIFSYPWLVPWSVGCLIQHVGRCRPGLVGCWISGRVGAIQSFSTSDVDGDRKTTDILFSNEYEKLFRGAGTRRIAASHNPYLIDIPQIRS